MTTLPSPPSLSPTSRLTAGRVRLIVALLSLLALGSMLPAQAQAHGPTVPLATSYIARISHVPAGLDAKVVDGDLQMWLRVPAGEQVTVLDYRGAPWVLYNRAGVWVNKNSEIYYLDQTPVAEPAPADLTAHTPPDWEHVSDGHTFQWHDGRLHALTTIALAPGTHYVGPWTLAVRIAGRLTSISGRVYYDGAPSIVWFWPIIVLIACVLAGWRLKRPALDVQLSGALALAVLAGIAVAAAGRELEGRPGVGAGQLAVFAGALLCVGYGASRVLLGRAGYFLLFTIAFAGLWVGGIFTPTMLNGYVLLAVPAFLARTATVMCIGGGISLVLMSVRMMASPTAAARSRFRARAASAPS